MKEISKTISVTGGCGQRAMSRLEEKLQQTSKGGGAVSHAYRRPWRRVESLPMTHTRAHRLRCLSAILMFTSACTVPYFAEPGHRERIRG